MIVLGMVVLAAAPKTGTVNVKASVAGAKVFIDDKPAGTVPLVIKGVVAGPHHVKVKRLGYLAADQDIVVFANAATDVSVDLLPFSGVLSVKANQKGAQVFVDGKGVGVVPFEGEVAIGRRSVEVKKDGFVPYRETFQAGAGEAYKIDCQLQKGNEPDVPLVALAPKRKKKADDDEIPLAAPMAIKQAPRPLDATDSAPGLVAISRPPQQWYQKWWVWTIVGGVVAGGVIAGVVIATNQPDRLDFRRALDAPSR